MDKILMKRMRFFGYHGVFEEEKRTGQNFIVTMQLMMDLEPAGRSDSVEDTVSYAEVYEVVKAIVEGPPMDLIEAVAQTLAIEVLKTFPRIEEVRVQLEKPEAPVDGDFEFFGVDICRKRQFI